MCVIKPIFSNLLFQRRRRNHFTLLKIPSLQPKQMRGITLMARQCNIGAKTTTDIIIEILAMTLE